mgnify:CR=1 FL=1
MSILTKSNSLVIINKINKNLVPEFIFFTKVNFLKKKFFYINKIKKQFKNDIIIRSSALNEDLKTKSNAGVYDFFLNKKNNFHQIESYILKINNEVVSKQDKNRLNQTIELYKNCLNSLPFNSLEFIDFKIIDKTIVLTSERCSNHAERALDELGDYQFIIKQSQINSLLNKYGKNILN